MPRRPARRSARTASPSPADLSYARAVYAGSFDPPTNGHMYIIRQGSRIFREVLVGVGVNPSKTAAFSMEQRVAMLRECTRELGNVRVLPFTQEFLVHFAEAHAAGVIIRGIRSMIDYEFEHRMRHVNADINPHLSTVFLMPPREMAELSSSFIKGLIGPRGWQDLVRRYVPDAVYKALLAWAGQRTGGGPPIEGE